MRLIILLFMSFSSFFVLAQSRLPLVGKVIAKDNKPQGVTVTNLAIKQMQSISSNGSFTILAQAGDTLYFKNIFAEEYKHVLSNSDMERDILFIPFESKFEEEGGGQMLNEIKITKFDMKSIGLNFPDAPKMTPVERMLYTASASSPIDALINSFTGRTAMLKKAIAYEKTEIASNKLLDLFSEEEISKQFNVELDAVKGFTYFLLDDKELKQMLEESKPDRRKVEFRISELVGDYQKQIAK
ncbi:MAG: hypothetical protein LBI72_11060 [Flavobacteriaceae bacterium]|jgi:hypothetical protein|nr:hypothetical protein [Flavobacteriaceae bacterium]